VKLVSAFDLSCGTKAGDVDDLTSRLLGHDLGILDPPGVEEALLERDEDVAFSCIEAVHRVMDNFSKRLQNSASYLEPRRVEEFELRVNEILNSHCIEYRFVDGEIVPLSSEEMHVEVVEPVLVLLHGHPEYESAYTAYLKALKEIAANDAPDAITDAGTALQEILTALGCRGNALGPLIGDARRHGLVAPHDRNLAEGIERFMHWASANRSEDGDAHHSSPAVLADAWLMVHIVGALILRLSDPAPRSETTPE
jgi:hypothetical protein